MLHFNSIYFDYLDFIIVSASFKVTVYPKRFINTFSVSIITVRVVKKFLFSYFIKSLLSPRYPAYCTRKAFPISRDSTFQPSEIVNCRHRYNVEFLLPSFEQNPMNWIPAVAVLDSLRYCKQV